MQRTLLIAPCSKHELPKLVAQASRTFRPGSQDALAMAKAYPVLFAASNTQNLWLAKDGENIVGHVGYVPRSVFAAGTRLAAATFGAVFVAEPYSGQGLATQLLAAAVQSARAQGAVLGWISGRRSLYERQGFVPLPRANVLRIANDPNADLGALTMTPIDPDQWAPVAALYANGSSRFDRNPQQWQWILRSRTVGFGAGQVIGIYTTKGDLSAYLAAEVTPRLRADVLCRRVWEWAGDPHATLAALRQLATADVAIEWLKDSRNDHVIEALPRAPAREVDLAVSVARWATAANSVDLPHYGLDYV